MILVFFNISKNTAHNLQAYNQWEWL